MNCMEKDCNKPADPFSNYCSFHKKHPGEWDRVKPTVESFKTELPVQLKGSTDTDEKKLV